MLIPIASGWFVVLAAFNLGRRPRLEPVDGGSRSSLIAMGVGYLLFSAALGSAPATGHNKEVMY